MSKRHRMPQQLSSQETVSDPVAPSDIGFISEVKLLLSQRYIAGIPERLPVSADWPRPQANLEAIWPPCQDKANVATVRLQEADPP